MKAVLKTARGPYYLSQGAAPIHEGGAFVLTLAIERADGIERIAFRCRIADTLVPNADTAAIIGRLAGWIEREFEMTRESALKTIRTERSLYEVVFDASNPGPFAAGSLG